MRAVRANAAHFRSDSCGGRAGAASSSTSLRRTTSLFPLLCAFRRPDQTHRRMVSGVRPASLAADCTSISSVDLGATAKYYTVAEPGVEVICRGKVLLELELARLGGVGARTKTPVLSGVTPRTPKAVCKGWLL